MDLNKVASSLKDVSSKYGWIGVDSIKDIGDGKFTVQLFAKSGAHQIFNGAGYLSERDYQHRDMIISVDDVASDAELDQRCKTLCHMYQLYFSKLNGWI